MADSFMLRNRQLLVAPKRYRAFKMRYWIAFLSVNFYLTAFSQSIPDLHKRLLLLTDSAKFTGDTTGISKFSNIPNICDDKIQWGNYHVTDLNFDGLNDLIYTGPCNPYNQTQIFLSKGSTLELVFECAGEVVAIFQNPTLIRINIFKESCSCDYYSDLTEITIDTNSNLTQNRITFHADTKIVLDDTLETFWYKGLLRTTPLDDSLDKKDECSDNIVHGNKLVSVKKAEVIQLSKIENWSLVLFREHNETYWIGWVAKK